MASLNISFDDSFLKGKYGIISSNTIVSTKYLLFTSFLNIFSLLLSNDCPPILSLFESSSFISFLLFDIAFLIKTILLNVLSINEALCKRNIFS
jgi:hypothetical protein